MDIEIKTVEIDSRSLSKNIFRQLEYVCFSNNFTTSNDGFKFVGGWRVLGKIKYPELAKQRHKNWGFTWYLLLGDADGVRDSIANFLDEDEDGYYEREIFMDEIEQIFLKA